jgi:hypothetical protein
VLKLVVALGLVLKLMWDVGNLWRWRRGQDILAIAGLGFGLLGALAMAFTAWCSFIGLGVFIPYVSSLSSAAALFTLAWGVGQAVNQFYLSGVERR